MSDDYERWLRAHGVGTEAVDLSARSPETVRLYLDVRPCPPGWPTARPSVHSMNPVGSQAMHELIDRHWRP